MKVPATSPALGTAAVLVIMAVALVRTFGGPDMPSGALAVVLAAAASALTLSGYRTTPVGLRRTSLLLFTLSILLLPLTDSPLLAIQRGVFVSGQLLAMLASVMFIAQCAVRSPRVQAVGASLRGRKPGHRYLAFTLTSQLFSGMLSMAGAHIMLVMAVPDVPDVHDASRGKADSERRIPVVVAVTRAFSAANFWSPVFGNMAILLALYPTVRWIDIFPIGFVLAQLVLAVGLLLNHFDKSNRALAGVTASEQPATPASSGLMRDAFPVVTAMLIFLGLLLTAGGVLHIGIVPALVLLAPLSALVLHLVTAKSGWRVDHAISGFRESGRLFPRLASEAMLFMAAGCAGSVMADAFPETWALQIGQSMNGTPFVGIAFLMLAIMAIGLAGIHPVLTAVFLASTITPEVLGLPPLMHMAAILTGWGMSTTLTPFSVLSLTASRYAGTTAQQISLHKNWLYALINTLLICLVLTGITLMMR